jgi:hypothetical protein
MRRSGVMRAFGSEDLGPVTSDPHRRGARGGVQPGYSSRLQQLPQMMGNHAFARAADELRAHRVFAPGNPQLARQLVVGGVHYTRTLWDESKRESDSDRTEGAPPKEMLTNSRVQYLINDRLRWTFASWAQLGEAVTNWEGPGPPEQVRRAHCEDPQGHPSQLPSLTDLIPRSGRLDDRGRSVEEFSRALMELDSDDALVAQSAISALTSSCGLFAGTLVDSVARGQNERLPLLFQRTFRGQYDAKAFEETILSISRGLPLLLHVIFPRLHEFVIEKAPGGGAYLYQAWVSQFNGLWWADREGIALRDQLVGNFLLPGAEGILKVMGKAQTERGRGTDINLTELAYELGDFLRADVFGDPAAVEAWRRLPFIADAVQAYHNSDPGRDKTIEAEIRVYEVRRPRAVVAALGGDETTPLGILVAQSLARRMQAVLPAAQVAFDRLKMEKAHREAGATPQRGAPLPPPPPRSQPGADTGGPPAPPPPAMGAPPEGNRINLDELLGVRERLRKTKPATTVSGKEKGI